MRHDAREPRRDCGLIVRAAGALLACTSLAPAVTAQTDDPLMAGFVDPPNDARPRVWWHWMNGNVTEDGIAKDIDWISRIGVGGIQNFDASIATPQVVERRLIYMTPEWQDAFRYAAGLAERKGLEMAIAASPGWSLTGGPWVQPRDGMKKLVWSAMDLQGGKRFAGRLPAPPGGSGPFQDTTAVQRAPVHDATAHVPAFYDDALVLAYPLDRTAAPLPQATFAAGGRQVAVADALVDGSYRNAAEVSRGTAEAPGEMTITYPSAVTIRSATIALGETGGPGRPTSVVPQLQASADGQSWRKIADIPLTNGLPTTVSFAPVTGTQFRVVFAPYSVKDRRADKGSAPGAIAPVLFRDSSNIPLQVRELRLSAEAVVDQFETKAGFSVANDYYALPVVDDGARGPAPADVIDLTARMRPDGSIDWTPPRGRWRVLRMGYSLTGTTNHPATPEATGLEVDKFDRVAVRDYMEHYLGNYAKALGPGLMGNRGLKAVIVDSNETGPSNWTPKLVAQFRRLRGYDPTPWLPTLTGALVGSRADSDRFLYDFRRTLADLLASEHYGEVARVAHEHRLTVYGEALELGRPALGNDIAMRRYADVPMGAMWAWQPTGRARDVLIADLKGAASAAHVYGKNLVAAESLTTTNAPWQFGPGDLKQALDLEFALGVNRPAIHTSVHQPLDKAPGLSLSNNGQYFNRHEAWADMAKPWIDYIARSSFLLQQGRYVADVAYFFGEEGGVNALFIDKPDPHAPTRYGYDYVDADALSDQFSVAADGSLATAAGASYRVLYLGGSSSRMTVPTLRRLAALATAGATIVGEKPIATPSLADTPAEFDSLVARLWGTGGTTRVGRGQVIATKRVEDALTALKLAPDVSFAGGRGDSRILFLHRRIDDGDIYFVTNRLDRTERVDATFRVHGKAAERWRAETGAAEPLTYRVGATGTTVPLTLAPHESAFIVFRKPAKGAGETVAATIDRPLATLDGPWEVAFQPGRGAPAATRLPTLADLSQNADAGIRYFSGVATYRKSFVLPANAQRSRLLLDLGRVGSVAEVRVNGVAVGTSWHAPYRLDIGAAARPGRNRIEIRVANTWVNRLIGDAQPGAAKVAFVTLPTYRPDAPLQPAGLIGPVSIVERIQGGDLR